MRPIPVPMRQRILQLYERGKGTREIAQIFRFLRGGGTPGAPAGSAVRHARAADSFERASHATDQGAETAAARAAVQATRRHAGRVGRAPGPALPDFHDRCMALATGLEVYKKKLCPPPNKTDWTWPKKEIAGMNGWLRNR